MYICVYIYISATVPWARSGVFNAPVLVLVPVWVPWVPVFNLF